MVTSKIVIVLPLPPKMLHPNARPHYMAKARATKKARADAGWLTLVSMNDADVGKPRWPEAACRARFYFAKPANRDRDNLIAWLKAYFDGVADAGLVANDAGITHLPVEHFIDTANPRVELHFERIGTNERGACRPRAAG